MVASHLGAIPFWDAKAYFYCVEEAVQKPFDLLNFRCTGHPSIAYAWLLGLTQYVKAWTPASLYAVNAIIGIASILAFQKLVELIFPDRPRREYVLLAALFGLAPLFVSHAIFLNLDFPATSLFVLFLYFLLARRFWLSGVFAVLLIFTKETGGVAYGLTLGAWAVASLRRCGRSWRERVAPLAPGLPALIVPAGALLACIAVYHAPLGRAGWSNAYAPVGVVTDRVDALLNTNLADPGMRSFLADIFVLNFQWLYTAVIAAAACAAVLAPAPRTPAPGDSPRRLRPALFLGLLLAGLVYITTRYRPYNNARYVLLVSPILIVVCYGALLSIVSSHRARLAYLGICAALVAGSNFRTIDVVSEMAFGTFHFGSHTLLDMPSLIGGLKLDSLVYNLEFLQLEYLYADMVRDVRPHADTVLLMGNAIWNFPPEIDGRTYALTADPSHAMPLVVAVGNLARPRLQEHMHHDGEVFLYAAFANADNQELLALRDRYEFIGTKRYDRHGYTLDLYMFRFRFEA